MGSKKSKTEKSSNTSLRANPEYERDIRATIDRANDAFNQSPVKYDGSLVAGFNDTQNQAHQNLLGQAGGLNAGANELRELGTATARGDFLDFNSSPIGEYTQQLSDIQRRNFDENQARNLDLNAIQSGAYGGSRHGLAEGVAERGFQEALTSQQAQIALQNYLQERGYQQNAGQLLGQANALSLAPGQLQASIGEQQQRQSQQELLGDYQLFNDDNQRRWNRTINYSNILNQQNPVGIGYDQNSASSGSTVTKDPAAAIKAAAAVASLFVPGGQFVSAGLAAKKLAGGVAGDGVNVGQAFGASALNMFSPTAGAAYNISQSRK